MSKKDTKRRIRETILHVLSNHGHRAFRSKELAQKAGLHSNDTYRVFRSTLQDLVRKGHVQRVKGNRFTHKKRTTEALEGHLRLSREGYGFVEIEGRETDLFVPKSRIRKARDGDRVRVRVLPPRRNEERPSAEVLDVLERAQSTVIGTTKKRGGTIFVIPDDVRFTQSVYIHESESAGLSSGTKVVVDLGEFDGFRNAVRGTIQDVLGDATSPEVLMKALIRQFRLPTSFPAAVSREAKAASAEIPEREYQRRLDLRSKPIFTIDPFDAKDFDDAIHVTPLSSGRYEVGVHIADVSYYVPLNGSVDKEALKRSTSVYLADRVIPMLPERLSNRLCSLRPGEDKLTFSCLMEVDEKANVHRFRFEETVIHSKHRFAYEEAQAIIEGRNGTHPMADSIKRAAAIARAFTKKRFTSGSIEFDLPEVKVILDEEGFPVEIKRKEIRESNRLIEEFMLLANQCAAKAIEQPGKTPPPFVYRVHDRPKDDRMQQLIGYVRAFGLKLETNDGHISSTQLNRLLNRIEGTPTEPIIKTAALRAMAKAAYSPDNIGHYGLGFSHYTHFTSPIRRYPDLIAHRLLKHYLLDGRGQPTDALEALCEHCSRQERLAEDAERASIKQKQVLYARQHLGEHFDGIVTSATRFGLFVEMTGLWTEGLVHVRDLDDDYYEYDEKTYALTGAHSGTSFRAGDSVRVQLTQANPDTREIDLLLVD